MVSNEKILGRILKENETHCHANRKHAKNLEPGKNTRQLFKQIKDQEDKIFPHEKK